MVADHLGVLGALRLMPLIAAVSALAFVVGRRHYDRDITRLTAPAAPVAAAREAEATV